MMKLLFAILAVTFCSQSSADVNIRVAPLGFAFGTVNAALDIPVADAFTLGPVVAFTDRKIGSIEVSLFQIGVTGMYSFSGKSFTNSFYFSPSLYYGTLKTSFDDPNVGTLSAHNDFARATFTGGYQWFWDGFNITLGAGIEFSNLGDVKIKAPDGHVRETYSNLGTGVDALFDVDIGYSF